MTTVAIPKKIDTLSAFEVKGEKFVVLKKDYLDEILILMRSFIEGEKLLGEKKTRSFAEFLKSIPKKKK